MSTNEVMAPPDVSVGEALARLGREGRPGVCDTGRYRCRFAVWGEGPPIVFVHGLNEVARSFAMTAAALCSDFSCILYELPTGTDDGAKISGYRHEHFADDLYALIDQLNLERTYLFAASFGSTIALRAMAACPGRFARTILQGGFARRPVAWPEVMMCRFARYAPGRMDQFPFKTSLKSERERAVFASLPPERLEFMMENSGMAPIATVARLGLMIAGLDLRALLPRVRVPVRMIGGDSDGIVPAECEAELLAGLPAAERLEIAGCGHLPQYTHPALLATLIRQFFTPECGRAQGPECEHHQH